MNKSSQILFLWTRISGYMSACWRKLAEIPDFNIHIIAKRPKVTGDQAPFDDDVAHGLELTLLSADECSYEAEQRIYEVVIRHAPSVIVVAGWAQPLYNKIARNLHANGCRVVMTMDTPWKGTSRQFAALPILRARLKHVDHVVVASERAWQYAKRIGFSEENITRGLYAWDQDMFGGIADRRPPDGADWPRKFLFVGRYVPEKGLDVIVEAYKEYRAIVDDPWPLTCCGSGELRSLLHNQDGIDDAGFVQPASLPDILRHHSVFIFPSRYEPWGVALAEAMGTGMPVICSEACGAAVELHHHLWTGWSVATGSKASLVDALFIAHECKQHFPSISRHCVSAAAPTSHVEWARRWHNTICRVCSTD